MVLVKYSIIFLLFFCTIFCKAQNVSIVLSGGVTHYSGDLGNDKIPKLVHPAFGAGFLYNISDKLSVNTHAMFGKLSGSDSYSTKTKPRNLSFNSKIFEVSSVLEYNFLYLDEHNFTPLVFGGVAFFKFNPYLKTATGQTLYLQKYGTEGQGFYDGRKAYKLTQFSIPLGVGGLFVLSDKINIALSFGIRKTFTDYIDDVSKTYVDATQLNNYRGPEAVAIAYRGDELPGGAPYPADGAQRGNPKNNDSYYYSNFSLRYKLASPDERGNGNKGKTGCPTVF